MTNNLKETEHSDKENLTMYCEKLIDQTPFIKNYLDINEDNFPEINKNNIKNLFISFSTFPSETKIHSISNNNDRVEYMENVAKWLLILTQKEISIYGDVSFVSTKIPAIFPFPHLIFMSDSEIPLESLSSKIPHYSFLPYIGKNLIKFLEELENLIPANKYFRTDEIFREIVFFKELSDYILSRNINKNKKKEISEVKNISNQMINIDNQLLELKDLFYKNYYNIDKRPLESIKDEDGISLDLKSKKRRYSI